MGKATGAIDINGNQYNAISGQLMGSAKKLVHKAKKTPGFQSIDGFVRKSASIIDLSTTTPQQSKNSSGEQSKPSTKPDAQTVHRRTERSKTLMRGGVKRPAAKPASKSAAVAQKSKTGMALLIEPKKAQRASQITKHSKVSRFGSPKPTPEPEVIQRAQPVNRHPAESRSAATKAVVMPSMVTSASHQQLERLLDQALLRADAHKQALRGRLPGQSRWQRLLLAPRWISMVAVLAVVLLLGAFFAWQNVPQVSMKIAASQAHIGASVPAYSPSGFKFAGPITASGGEVTMKFIANGDMSRSFSISQKNSDWDSASLLSNYINPTHQTFQTSQIKGTTVYIYGNNNDATWVNNGIWYTIKDKAELNSDQLLKIADSM